uniref:Uncharacterized protein n=1 Tax=Nelumbo nucifera TaxID=4432 RepID=A0A822Z210_NELNU|nr:TPA_asm: hypothetical protein HUJ06_013375 [Nelumbo nucifera]
MSTCRRNLLTVSITLIILLSVLLPLVAARPLDGDHWVLQLQSLQRGPVPPSGPSCGTNLPNRKCL